MESRIIFENKNGQPVTNFEITRDSILEVCRNKYDFETIDIECFLDKLKEETLEVILNDISTANNSDFAKESE